MAAIASEPRRVGPRWRPRWTVRLRLTLLYGGLFLVAGALLLAITYGLVAHTVSDSSKQPIVLTTHGRLPAGGGRKVGTLYFSARPGSPPPGPLPAGVVPPRLRTVAIRLQSEAQAQIVQQRNAQLDALLTKSGIALAIMALVSIALGWLMAGRALRPVRTMNARVRQLTEHNLHERLALDGHDDELKELSDTFDGLLERLELAFESQRHFVANASHELRTPITLERTLLEVALADPELSTDTLRATCERVLATGEQQERLIDALLALARSQRGIDEREPIDLGVLAAGVLQASQTNEGRAGVRVESALGSAPTIGDPALVERLVANLLDNAIHHNCEGGWVRAWSGLRDGLPTFQVTNTGPVIRADQAQALIEPFRRLQGDRTGHERGVGLGLSIVRAIATAHGAELIVTARPEGGLDVEVRFPARTREPRAALALLSGVDA